MSSDASTLHPIERTILKALAAANGKTTNEKLIGSQLSTDQVRRGIEWLKFKNLISIKERTESIISLDVNGLKVKNEKRLPERRLVDSVKDGNKTIDEIIASEALDREEVNAAIAGAKRNDWIRFEGKTILLNPNAESAAYLSPEERLIQKFKISNAGSISDYELSDEEKIGLDLLSKRPNYVRIDTRKEAQVLLTDLGWQILPAIESERIQERRLTSELITSGRWKNVEFSALDVEAPAPVVYSGRRHPLVDIIEEVKEIFVGLGFSEIDGPMVQSGFWNFDALFTPQDHPAREMQDTFYVSGQRQKIPASNDQIAKVSAVHNAGWGSWKSAEAERRVLRTHTTPVTLQHLAKTQPDSARFFSVGRVFRNEKVSYKHLVEFHQVEGVATAPKASLRDLMGLQKEFYSKMGIKKVKFWPTFFPYTEPSLQSMVYNEKLEKWVELFGMGIFRPEVTKPLGIKNPVLAWGGGLERIAMLRFALDDVRELYGNRLAWLRSVPRCQL